MINGSYYTNALLFIVSPFYVVNCITQIHEDQKCPRINAQVEERDFFIVNLLVRIHSIIETIMVDRPCAMGV